MLFLTDWPCTWFRRWVYRVWADCSAFDFSHVVDIPICGNRLWYALTLPLRSDCWGCKGILDLTEQTWIFHTNHVKRVSGIWKILVNRVGRWEYAFVDPYGIMASNWLGYPDPDGRAKIIIPLLSVSSFLRSWFSLLGYLTEITWPHLSLILRMTMDVINIFDIIPCACFSDLCPHIYDIYSGFVAVRSSLLRPIIQEGDKVSW